MEPCVVPSNGSAGLAPFPAGEVIDLTESGRALIQMSARRDGLEDLGDERVAVLLPCHNEEVTIGGVVRDFRKALPGAAIYVYDNASTDRTGEVAGRAGAIVRSVPLLGKGNVIRRMFAEVDASVYVLADGDGTYDAAASPTLVRRLRQHHLDMVVGLRLDEGDTANAYRRGHRFGNCLLGGVVRWLFGSGAD